MANLSGRLDSNYPVFGGMKNSVLERCQRGFSYWVLLFVPAAMVQFSPGGHIVMAADVWLLAFALWQFTKASFGPVRHLSKGYLTIYIFAFVAYLAVVVFGLGYAADTAGVFKELAKWSEIFLISLGVALYAKSQRRFANLYWAMFFILIGLCLFFMARNIGTGHFFERMYVTPDWAIALSLPFLRNTRLRIIYVLILIPCLILSYSRLAWASTALEVGVLILLSKGSNRRRIVVALAGAVALWAVVSVFVPRFFTILSQRVMVTFNPQLDQSAFTRDAMIRAGLLDFAHHPLIGVGAGNFKSNVIAHQAGRINFWLSAQALPNSPHSVLVQTAAELGLPGLLAFIAILLVVLVCVKRGYAACKRNAATSPYATGMVLFVVPLAVTLLASNIGDTSRVLWGLYFGLALVFVKLHVAPTKLLPRGVARDVLPRNRLADLPASVLGQNEPGAGRV